MRQDEYKSGSVMLPVAVVMTIWAWRQAHFHASSNAARAPTLSLGSYIDIYLHSQNKPPGTLHSMLFIYVLTPVSMQKEQNAEGVKTLTCYQHDRHPGS